MHDLNFTSQARAAATHLIHTTPLCFTLDGHHDDDGKVLTVAVNVDVYERMASGERTLLGLLEYFANQRMTVPAHQFVKLDDACRVAVAEAWRMYLAVPVAQAVA